MNGDPTFYNRPAPCPNCGHCPTCGQPARYGNPPPYWQGSYYSNTPWVNPNRLGAGGGNQLLAYGGGLSSLASGGVGRS